MTEAEGVEKEFSFDEYFMKFLKTDKYDGILSELRLQKCMRVLVPIDFMDLVVFDREYKSKLAEVIAEHPMNAFEIMRKTIFRRLSVVNIPLRKDLNKVYNGEGHKGIDINIYNYDTVKYPDEITISDAYTLVAVRGVIEAISQKFAFLKTAIYTCSECGMELPMEVDILRTDYSIDAPLTSPHYHHGCPKSAKWMLRVTESYHIDHRIAMLAPPPDVRHKFSYHPLRCELYGVYADMFRCGENVILYGTPVFRRWKRKKETVNELSFIVLGYKKLSSDYTEIVISPEDEKKILEVSQRPDLLELFARSLVPSVAGYETIKKALVLWMFSGMPTPLPDGSWFRNSIHILLLGDPSTAKSKMASALLQYLPRVVFVSGEGVTGVGLTASVRRDPVTGEWMLEAGAFAVADGGHLVIDEFDKAPVEARRKLHEAMSIQKVTIQKVVSGEFPTRCAVLAVCNPAFGRFIPERPLVDNLPPIAQPLLSRFDLIFIIRDVPDKERDFTIATHIFRMQSRRAVDSDILSPDFIRKYVLYARQNIEEVEIPEELAQEITDFYVNLRSNTSFDPFSIPITPRQLEGIIRLVKASARLHLRSVATKRDLDIALRIMKASLSQIGAIEEGEAIDVSVIETGEKTNRRKIRFHIITGMNEWMKKHNERYIQKEELEEFYEWLCKKYKNFSDYISTFEEFKDFLSTLNQRGEIIEVKGKGYAPL